MTIKAGDRIPSVNLKKMGEKGPEAISTDAVFGGRKVVLFAVPGAFTPTPATRAFDERATALVVNAALRPRLTIAGTFPQLACAGQPVTLDAGVGYATYSWSPGGGCRRCRRRTTARTTRAPRPRPRTRAG